MAPAVWLASLGAFLCSLDSALNVAFPAISAAFGVVPGRIALLIVFYHVPIGVLTVLGGVLGDRFGHRRVFAAGLCVVAVAFPWCGLATDFTWLLAGRAIQGVGTGLVFGTAPALVTLALALDRRAPGLGVLNLAAGAGSATAPLLAGALVDHFGWRAVFLFRVPLALAAAALALWPARAGRVHAPSTSHAVPDIPRRVVLCDALAVAANVAFFSIYVFGPYYLVDVVGHSATLAGALFMLVPLSQSVGGLAGGWLTRRVRPEALVVTGLALETIGVYAIATLDAGSGAVAIATAFALTGGGLGLFQVPNIALVMAALPDRSQGLAGGMIAAMRTVGIVTVSLAAPWFFVRRAAARETDPTAAFVGAFSDTFLVSAAIAACAVGFSLLLLRKPAGATTAAPDP